MTLGEALQVAQQHLDQNGRLLNSQLLKLVDGDEALCREVRESLIFDGLAIDRNGVGLARAVPLAGPSSPPTPDLPKETSISVSALIVEATKLTAPELVPEASPTAEEPMADAVSPVPTVDGWWWMADGQVLGPADKESIEAMWQCGELLPNDVVRQGRRGMWQRPEDVLKPLATSFSPHRARVGSEQKAPPPRRSVEEAVYFFWESGRSTGPVTRTELLERLNEGKLKPDEFVQVGEGGDWQPISTLVSGPSTAATEVPAGINDNAPSASKVEQPPPARELPNRSAFRVPRSSLDPPIVRSEVRTPSSEFVSPKRAPKQAAAAPGKPSRPPSSVPTNVVEQPKAGSRFSIPILRFGWQRAAELAGSERSLVTGLAVVALAIAGYVWWFQAPSANSIHRQFTDCYAKVKELRNRPGVELSELTRTISRSRSRVEYLISGLKNPRSGASSRQPAKQELLWTGENELLKLLSSTKLDPRMELELERQFESRMSEAKRLIDGGAVRPQSPRPVASGPPSGMSPGKMTVDLMTGETRSSPSPIPTSSSESAESGQGDP